jgi:hypothetical protein
MEKVVWFRNGTGDDGEIATRDSLAYTEVSSYGPGSGDGLFVCKYVRTSRTGLVYVTRLRALHRYTNHPVVASDAASIIAKIAMIITSWPGDLIDLCGCTAVVVSALRDADKSRRDKEFLAAANRAGW